MFQRKSVRFVLLQLAEIVYELLADVLQMLIASCFDDRGVKNVFAVMVGDNNQQDGKQNCRERRHQRFVIPTEKVHCCV